MTKKFQHFSIIGGGAWGTALGLTLLRAGRAVTLWAHRADVVDTINHKHKNEARLPGVALDARLKATADMEELAGCDAFLFAMPAQHVRRLSQQIAKIAKNKTAPVIIATKGIETDTGLLLGDIIAAELPGHPVAILSGPSFALEVANGLPVALTLAIRDKEIGEELAAAIATPSFRLYQTTDVTGAQIGGAVKNVLAIACGIITGRAMGDNARAALITRGLAEIMRFGVACGGRAETLMGLSGLGDLVLTCSSTQSRNLSLGIALGKGEKLADILATRTGVTEGVTTAAAALVLAKKFGVEMPIVSSVDAVLNRNGEIDAEIASLLARPLKAEAA